jgi:hypothetical protein
VLDVQSVDDVEPYKVARVIDSDDDRPIRHLIESDIELLRHFYHGQDPLVNEFSDLSHAHNATTRVRCNLGNHFD